ncbi:nuclear pore complex protein Nup214 [Caerostris extrusa]|uniref:Nuclear pore complex protein Nup214 n=1 Tax=Caerostris extrusa TaxID=172846 RepID=A0AAV4P3W5_CAEEX|nr:nuclear pore complex protein Nup214 [Caerostris extrusa]
MIEEGPDPKEVAHFHFVQLRTLKIAKTKEQVHKNPVNVIATASKYGLIFVGITNGFKVLKFENILDLDENKENKSLEENYFSQDVSCETPVLLSLSADQKTLAVCIQKNSGVVVDFYDIAAFADPESNPVPFQNAQLSTKICRLREFIWNPVSDGMFAYCLSDGSLGVQELNGFTLIVLADLPGAGATAACWSPKGKQLVVGKKDGSLTQYKPNLHEVKSIPIPPMKMKIICVLLLCQCFIMFISFRSVANICWISTTQFAVLYMPPGKNISPYLFIVSTPKGAPTIYVNHFDVCLGSASGDDQRYFLHHEPTWNVLICSSTDSIEVAVLGEAPSWVQWDLRDDGRIILPAKHGAQCAIGQGVMYCSQRRIIINDNESYPPMPIIFFLTDNGLLVSYHMVNSAPGCPNLVRPSTPISKEGERKKPGAIQNSVKTHNTQVNVSKAPEPYTEKPAASFFHSPALGSANSASFNTGSLTFNFSQASTQPNSQSASVQSFIPFHKVMKSSPSVIPSESHSKDSAIPQLRPTVVAQRSGVASKIEGDINNAKETIPGQDDAYKAAICEEIQAMEKEILELKKSSEFIGIVGTQDEMKNLLSCTMTFEEFNKDMTETMVSLNSDIHSLKNALLESFVMVEQAHARERRKNDNSYLSMLRDRALDPLTAKRMQKIEHHYHYLSVQLHAISNRLDAQWLDYVEPPKNESIFRSHHISSTEAIYKSVVNNQKVIHNLRQNVTQMASMVAERKLENISKRSNKTQFLKRIDPEELSKLADAFLKAKIINTEDEKPPLLTKKISLAAQETLMKYLSNSVVEVVRPTANNSRTESRLLSKSLLFRNSSDFAPDEKDASITIQPPVNKGNTIVKPAVTAQPVFSSIPPTFVSLNEINEKNLMSINKPQVTSTSEFEKLRQRNLTSNIKEFEEKGIPKISPQTSFASKPPEFMTTPVRKNLGFTAKPVATMMFSTPKFSTPPTVEDEIPIPEYEDITPPDSPSASINSEQVCYYEDVSPPDSPNTSSQSVHCTPGYKIIKVSYNQGVPEVQTSELGDVSTSIVPEALEQSSNLPVNEQKASFFIATSEPFTFFPPTVTTTTTTTIMQQPVSENAKPLSGGITMVDGKSGFASNTTTTTNGIQSPKAFDLKSAFPPASSATTNAQSASTFGLKNTFSATTTEVQSTSIFGLKNAFPPASSAVITEAQSTSTFGLKNAFSSTGSSAASEVQSSKTFEFKNTFTPTVPFVPQTAFGASKSESSPFSKTPTAKSTSAPFSFFQPAIATTVASKQPTPLEQAKTSPSKLITTNAKSIFSQSTLTTTLSQTPPVTQEQQPNNNTTVDMSKNETTSQSSAPSLPSFSAQSAFTQAPINLIQKIQLPEEKPQVSADATSQISTSPVAINLSTTVTTATSLISKSVVTTSPTSGHELLFRTPAVTAESGFISPVSQQDTVSTTNIPATNVTSAFNQPTSAIVSEPGQTLDLSAAQSSPPPPQTTTASLVFQTAATTSQPVPIFGQTSTSSSIFGPSPNVVVSAPAPTSVPTTESASVFGQPSTTPSFFGQPASTQSVFFGKPASETPAFGQSQPFGTSTQANSFTQPAGSFFSQSSTIQTSVFPVNTSGNTGFGNQSTTSNFSFGKSTFGQAQGAFDSSKSIFGQNASTFGAPVSSPQSTPFGQSSGGSIFGQGSFFSGLGGQPSAENANKNVFGKPSSDSSSIFGSGFGNKSNGGSFSGGSFSSGGGSVAQTGFGAFQQTPQKTGY